MMLRFSKRVQGLWRLLWGQHTPTEQGCVLDEDTTTDDDGACDDREDGHVERLIQENERLQVQQSRLLTLLLVCLGAASSC